MSPLLALPLNLLFPIVPWIGLSPIWAISSWSKASITMVFVSGLVLDLWWGRPLGATPLILLTTTVILYFLNKVWPFGGRALVPLSALLGIVMMEAYLLL